MKLHEKWYLNINRSECTLNAIRAGITAEKWYALKRKDYVKPRLYLLK